MRHNNFQKELLNYILIFFENLLSVNLFIVLMNFGKYFFLYDPQSQQNSQLLLCLKLMHNY